MIYIFPCEKFIPIPNQFRVNGVSLYEISSISFVFICSSAKIQSFVDNPIELFLNWHWDGRSAVHSRKCQRFYRLGNFEMYGSRMIERIQRKREREMGGREERARERKIGSYIDMKSSHPQADAAIWRNRTIHRQWVWEGSGMIWRNFSTKVEQKKKQSRWVAKEKWMKSQAIVWQRKKEKTHLESELEWCRECTMHTIYEKIKSDGETVTTNEEIEQNRTTTATTKQKQKAHCTRNINRYSTSTLAIIDIVVAVDVFHNFVQWFFSVQFCSVARISSCPYSVPCIGRGCMRCVCVCVPPLHNSMKLYQLGLEYGVCLGDVHMMA